MEVREVSPLDTVELRRQVLRDGRPVALPGDDEEQLHLGVYDGDLLVGTGNLRPERAKWAPGRPGWRIRGMATLPSHRSRGVGALVLTALIEHVEREGGGVLWCNARIPAQRFYERHGLQTRGEPWEDPEIGPHVVMFRDVTTSS